MKKRVIPLFFVLLMAISFALIPCSAALAAGGANDGGQLQAAGDTTSSKGTAIADGIVVCSSMRENEKFLERGVEIASEFQNVPNDYLIYSEQELADLLGGGTYYFSLLPQLELCFGDTVPVYFLAPDGDKLIAVKRDKEGNSYSFSFNKNGDDEWELFEDVLMNQHEISTSESEVRVNDEAYGTVAKAANVPEPIYVCK